MTTKRSRTSVALGVFGIVAVVLVPLVAQPVTAVSRTMAPDVAQIDAFVQEQVRRHGIPGLSLAVVDGNQVVHLQGYGKADQTGRAVSPQTPFVLASVSKPITALAVMQLVEAGKVALDAPVQRDLPAFRVADPMASQQITVRHLLQHTNDIPALGCQTSRFGAETLEQVIATLQTIEVSASVGTHDETCIANDTVLGRIIEVVFGQTFGTSMQQRVFLLNVVEWLSWNVWDTLLRLWPALLLVSGLTCLPAGRLAFSPP